MKHKEFKFSQSTKEKMTRIGIVVIGLVWIISTYMAYKAIIQPIAIEKTVVENTIEVKSAYDYKVRVNPSILYPTGGVVTPDLAIFNSLTDQLIVQLGSNIISKENVTVKCDVEINYNIISNEMWDRTFNLIPRQTKHSEGVTHTILDEEKTLNLKEIFDYIKSIEEQTLVRPNGYLVVISQTIKGNVYDSNGIIHEINNELKIPFEVKNQYIRYAGETLEKEFVESFPIEKKVLIPQEFNLFNMQISIVLARYIFGASAIILFVLLILVIKKVKRQNENSEELLIDKKYKNKIVEVIDKLDIEGLPHIRLKSFKALLKVSEEKDENILKYSDNDQEVYYYILGVTSIYFYCISDKSTKRLVLAHDA